MFNPRVKLAEALAEAESYMDLVIKSRDRGEREFFERMVQRYLAIAIELEDMID
jgi:hypothetical protein